MEEFLMSYGQLDQYLVADIMELKKEMEIDDLFKV